MDDRDGRKFKHLDREVHIKQGANGDPLFSIDPYAPSREYSHSWHTKDELADVAKNRYGIKGRKLKAIQEKANAQERLMNRDEYVYPPHKGEPEHWPGHLESAMKMDRQGLLEPDLRDETFKGLEKDRLDEDDFDTDTAERATAFNLMGLKGPRYSD